MIEHAYIREHGLAGQHPLSGAPAHIRAAINRRRSAAGLAPILGRDELLELDRQIDRVRAEALTRASGTGVWIDPESRLVPKGARPAANGYYRLADCAPPITRVLLACYGGTARRVRDHKLPERIVRGAFGTVAELNSDSGWMLKDRHDGPILAVALPGKPALRAVALDPCLIIEWLPNMGRADHADAVRRIEAGMQCSLCWASSSAKRAVRDGVELLCQARLLHIALEPAGAYPGAIVRAFRDKPATAAERARQIAEIGRASDLAAEAASR